VVTCAHVVSELGKTVSRVSVGGKAASIQSLHQEIDLAVLSTDDTETCQLEDSASLQLGEQLVFSGLPTGVLGPSVFSGILSAHGENLAKYPRCRLLQINGMINLGNSGGPVLKAGTQAVVGVVTAKYVPLLQEIDKLRDILRQIPQFPTEVGIGQVNFSGFVNLTTRALLSISGSLRLVQVGIGYAIPIDLWTP
jgi:S1-C subfamily serine protease